MLLLLALLPISSSAMLARTPPMGWMSWQTFRCNPWPTPGGPPPVANCTASKSSTKCISEALFQGVADALLSTGLAAAGYTGVHVDDCWQGVAPGAGMGRNYATGELQADAGRFPSGMAALGEYMHSRGLTYGHYSAASVNTCDGFPGSKDFEETDAKTFANWTVDYLKLDGCAIPRSDLSYYAPGFTRMGAALNATGRAVVYSCSWPAYLGDDERTKPFDTFIAIGCNLWRNWHDIQCRSDSLFSIIDHFGDYAAALGPFAGPGHWHDPDQLLIGAGCLTEDEERTQMAVWSVLAAPLLMGNDPRHLPAESLAILTNPHAIAVDQDALGRMGARLEASSNATEQRWWRQLENGDVAAALMNRGAATAAIELDFAAVGLFGSVGVFDIWAQQGVGVYNGSFTASAVPPNGTAFYRLSKV